MSRTLDAPALLRNGDEGGRLRDHLEQLTGRPVAALMSPEIGGSTGLNPVAWAARIGLPVLGPKGWAGRSPRSRRSAWRWPGSRRARAC